MIPKFSLVIGIAAAALVLVAPAGAVFPTLDGGDTGYAERAGSAAGVAPDFWNYDASGQKVADTSPGMGPEDVATLYSGQRLESAARREVSSMLDARERSLATGLYVRLSTSTPPDVFERAVAAGPVDGSMLDRFIANDNRFQPRPTNPTVAVSVGSGSEIEWPQLGIVFGIGMVLAIGLLLTLRATRQRPLAH